MELCSRYNWKHPIRKYLFSKRWSRTESFTDDPNKNFLNIKNHLWNSLSSIAEESEIAISLSRNISSESNWPGKLKLAWTAQPPAR